MFSILFSHMLSEARYQQHQRSHAKQKEFEKNARLLFNVYGPEGPPSRTKRDIVLGLKVLGLCLIAGIVLGLLPLI